MGRPTSLRGGIDTDCLGDVRIESAHRSGSYELGVRFDTTLGCVYAVVLLFFRNPNPDGHLQYAPDDQAADKYPDEDGQSTDDLSNKGDVGVGKRHE